MELCWRSHRFFTSCEQSCGQPETRLRARFAKTRLRFIPDPNETRGALAPPNIVVWRQPSTPNCIDLPCERVLAIIFTTTRRLGAVRHFNASSIARTLWLQIIRRQNDLQFSRRRDRDRRPQWLRQIQRLRRCPLGFGLTICQIASRRRNG